MCIVSFIGIDEGMRDEEMSGMVEYLNVSSLLIRDNHVNAIWTRWLKPDQIAVDRKIEEFRNRVMQRFSIGPDCVKNGVSLPEDIIWNSDADVYVIGTTSEIKAYVESYLRLDTGLCGEVCRAEDFISPYIYQIQGERKSEDCVIVRNEGFLYKKNGRLV